MFSPNSSLDAGSGGFFDDLDEAGVYANRAQAEDHGLVILAMGLPYWLEAGPDRVRVLVPVGTAPAVREQLALFDRESVGWPPRGPEPARAGRRPGRWITPLLWAIAVLIVFNLQSTEPAAWTQRGVLDAEALFYHGEWWRPFTALFLHGDLGHVLANLVAGLFVFAELIGVMGPRRGWLGLAGAAGAGNVAAAALHYPGAYESLGASTAVFAALGLLTGRSARLAWHARSFGRLRSVILPLAAGAVLLAMFGGGGGDARTDVVAHTTGFLAGVVVGAVLAREKRDERVGESVAP